MNINEKEHGAFVEKVREETKSYVRSVLHQSDELRGLVAEPRAENARPRDDA